MVRHVKDDLLTDVVRNYVQIKSLTRVRDIRDQLSGLCERVEISPESNPDTSDVTPVQKAILSGYFNNCARLSRSGDSYKVMKAGGSHSVFIHPSSCLFQVQPPARCVLFYELVMTSKEYVRQVINIDPKWLLEGMLGIVGLRLPALTLYISSGTSRLLSE